MKDDKILFVTTHFAPDYHYGGVVESGTKLLQFLRKLNPDIDLIAVSKNPDRTEVVGNMIYKSTFLHSWGFSFSLIWNLLIAIKKTDKIYINGIVTFPTTLAKIYAVIFRKPFITSIRGGLEPWRVSHRSWKKKPFLYLITYPLLKNAKWIHVTSSEEQNNLHSLGFNKTFMVSNGLDNEIYQNLPVATSYIDDLGKEKFMFLFLSRVDKEKGIDILIEAYNKFCRKYAISMHQLLIVGPDNQGYLKGLKLDLASKNIIYINGVYGEDKIKLFRQASVFLLPSYSENFGNVVAEALACETPVITTTGTPWSSIEDVECGFYIAPNADELFEAMEKAFQMNKNELRAMGVRGRKYILSKFSWQEKAGQIYQQLEAL